MLLTSSQLDEIITIAKSYDIKRLILFGSVLKDSGKAKDIDLACDGVRGWELYEFSAKIEEYLNMPVDIISLNPPSRLTRYIESKGNVLL